MSLLVLNGLSWAIRRTHRFAGCIPTFRNASRGFFCARPSSYGMLQSTPIWSHVLGRAFYREEASRHWLVTYAKATWNTSIPLKKGIDSSVMLYVSQC